MTVSTTIAAEVFPCNGTQTLFSVAFSIADEDDVRVLVRDGATDTLQTLNVDYTVGGVGGASGFTVTMTVAPALGRQLVVYRETVKTQDTLLTETGGFNLTGIMAALDRQARLIQELADVVARTARVQVGETPIAAFYSGTALSRAGRALIFTDDGLGLEVGFVAGDIASAQANAEAAAASALAAQLAQAAAELAAASVNLPPLVGKALNYMRVNAAETDFELRTPTQVLTDLGLSSTASELNFLHGADPALAPDVLAAPANFLAKENRVINGAFDFWQRSTSTAVNNAYAADRWKNNFIGGSQSHSQQAFPIGTKLGRNNPEFFLRIAAAGGASAGDSSTTQQFIEDVRSYAGETITVLGWAKRNAGAGNMGVNFQQNFGTGGSPSAGVSVAGQQVALTTSWAPFALTFIIPSVSGKTLGTNQNSTLALQLWASAGSNFPTSSAGIGVQTIDIDLWGLHILRGSHGVDSINLYVTPELSEELLRCQRYFWSTLTSSIEYATYGIAGNSFYTPFTLPTKMRSTPTFAVSNTAFSNASTAIAGGASNGGQAAFLQATCTALGRCTVSARVTADAEY